MKQAVAIRIHREDHTCDPLARVFLGDLAGEAALGAIRRYLGAPVRLVRVEVAGDVLEVDCETPGFPVERQNMLEIGRRMLAAGRERGALSHLEEARRLLPLDAELLKLVGRIHHRRRERSEARDCLVRAREIAPDDVGVLTLLGELELHDGRRLQARRYLERALELAPEDRRVRAALQRCRPAEVDAAGAPPGEVVSVPVATAGDS